MIYTPSYNYQSLSKFSAVVIFVLLALLSTRIESAAVIADYDSNWVFNSTESRLEHQASGLWTTLAGGHAVQSISLNDSVGVSNGSAQIDMTGYGDDGLFKIYFAYDENRYTTLDAPVGNNRMVLNVTIPYESSGHTFHIGTYSKNPATAGNSSTIGNHWYHYYELRGSRGNYWTKMYMNQHPQHEVSNSSTIPLNPTMPSWDYFSGLTRLYLQMRYSPIQSQQPWSPYTMYVDEVYFYDEQLTENEYSINGVAITYQGTGEFDIDWSSFSQYEVHNELYEVRYSLSPIITETDYTQAALVPGSPSAGWGQDNVGHHDNHYRANFTISNFDESGIVYFAIKDLYPSHPREMKRVDYRVNGSNDVVARPLPPTVLPPTAN